MTAIAEPTSVRESREHEAPTSPAGPVDPSVPVRMPPSLALPRIVQTVMLGLRPFAFELRAQRDLGDVWRVRLLSREEPIVVTSHPDHVRSLFTAKPADTPSLTGESPLRPILGESSVLTMVG